MSFTPGLWVGWDVREKDAVAYRRTKTNALIRASLDSDGTWSIGCAGGGGTYAINYGQITEILAHQLANAEGKDAGGWPE